MFPVGRRSTRRLAAGRPAIVLVHARTAGQVEIPRLGLDASVDPRTPARFDVLAREPGEYKIRFTPATGDELIRVGRLVVTGSGRRP